MSKYTEDFPNLSTYDFDTIMCQLKQVCGADPSGMINAQFLSRPTTAKDIALLLHITYELFQSQVELQKQFVELYEFVKDFFENLDLQEEVNKWLNDALSDGTLENLLSSVGLIRVFNTTTDMLNSTSDFYSGMTIFTNGYYTVNDGGNGVFIVQNSEDENRFSFLLKNGKYAIYVNDKIVLNAIGGKGDDSAFDNHDYILQAVDKRLSYNNEIIFNSQVYYTKGVKFPSVSCLKIKGEGTFYYPDFTVRGTILRGIESGAGNNDCIFDISSVSGNQKGDISIEDIIIDGNNLYNDGIRLTFADVAKHLYCMNCLSAGIRLTSPVYPVYLNECGAFHNKYGLLVEGPSSTVYSLSKCEFSRNIEGIVINGGAGFSFIDCLAQSNKGVGLRIERTSGYLSNGLFQNLYLENNGTLEETDPNYSGNFSVIINGKESSPVSPIIMNGGFINRPSNAKNFKLAYCYYLAINGMSINWDNGDEIDDFSNIIKQDFGNNYGSNPNNMKIMSGYQRSNDTKVILKNYGESSPFSNAKTFILTLDEITAGESKQMTFDNILNAIPFRGKFIVLSLQVGKIYNKQTSPSPEQENGRLDFWVTYGRQYLPSIKLTSESNAYLDNTEVGGSRRFNFYRDTLLFVPSAETTSDWSVGILCTASSDYSTSEAEASKKIYAAITVIEV